MVETVQLHDFIEVEYTGKLPEGVIFDTTHEDIAKKSGIFSQKTKYTSHVICVGEGHILPGIDTKIIGKEVGKEYTLELESAQAFGKRDIKKMRIVPLNTFREHNLKPQPGLQIDVDGEIGIVSSISGGRVIVNFNHPLAGKDVIYNITLKRKITDIKEKMEYYLSTTFRIKKEAIKVTLADNKASIEVPFILPQQFFDAMSKRLQEIIGLTEVQITGKQTSQTAAQI